MYSLRPRHLLPPVVPNDTGSGTFVLLRGGSGTFELPLGGSGTFVLLLLGSGTDVLLPGRC